MEQARWNSYGLEQLEQIRREPERYKITTYPGSSAKIRRDLVASLGSLRGKQVLDLGCGRGEFAVWLAQQGAIVSGVDLGPSLVAAADELARVNGVVCDFKQGNITALPFGRDQFDLVTGIAILHHLSPEDSASAVLECRRVLRPGGRALFQEPIENSAVFDFLQNLIPAKGKKPRPSILNRRKWREWQASLDDRVMSDRELRRIGLGFSGVDIRHYGLTVRLARLIGRRERLQKLDERLLASLPLLGRYAQSALVTYTK